MKSAMKRVNPGATAPEIQRFAELCSALDVAQLMIQAALRREESRGAHFREDFPQPDEKHWRGHLQVRRSARGEPVWMFSPLDINNLLNK